MTTHKSRHHSEWFSIVVIVVLMIIGRSSLADHYYVPSGSMENSLFPGDRVVVDKTAYGVRLPLTKEGLQKPCDRRAQRAIMAAGHSVPIRTQ